MGIPEPPHRWAEEELVTATQNEDSSALEELLQQHRALLHGQIRKLPRALRSVVLTRHLNESSIEMAARDLGITDAAVKGRLRRARLMLLEKLQQRPRARARIRRLPLEA